MQWCRLHASWAVVEELVEEGEWNAQEEVAVLSKEGVEEQMVEQELLKEEAEEQGRKALSSLQAAELEVSHPVKAEALLVG